MDPTWDPFLLYKYMKSLVESILGDQDDILKTAETAQVKSNAQFNNDVQLAIRYVKKCIENTGIAFRWAPGYGDVIESAYLNTTKPNHTMVFQNVCAHMEKAFNGCVKKLKCKYEIETSNSRHIKYEIENSRYTYIGPKLIIYNGDDPHVVIAVTAMPPRRIEINFPKLTLH